MSKKTDRQRIIHLEREVKSLRKWQTERVESLMLLGIGQRVTDRLFEIGADKIDLELIATLSAALGCDLMPIAGKPTEP